MKKRGILILLLLVFLGVGTYAGTKLYQELSDRKRSKDTFSELAQLIQPAQTETAPISTTEPEEQTQPLAGQTESTEQETQPAKPHKRDILALMEKNADCIGWVCIEDTAVDYPVMYTPDEPQRYLYADFYGDYSTPGTPFMDGKCGYTSDNLTIYGHNMKNGTMFSALRYYVNQEHRDEHPIIEFETEDGCGSYTIFAVARINNVNRWYSFHTAADEADFDQMVAYLKSIALYDTGITPTYGQQLLTLSTCYGSSKDGRLIVVGVLSDPESVD